MCSGYLKSKDVTCNCFLKNELFLLILPKNVFSEWAKNLATYFYEVGNGDFMIFADFSFLLGIWYNGS